MNTPKTDDNELVKACCAALYESDWARLLLGNSFHPGGLTLTERLGQATGLQPHHRVLDVAAGRGTSALFLAQRFGCQVVGVDYGAETVKVANEAARDASLAARVTFRQGDAECLPFAGATFDAVICECAFCTFPDKETAASQFHRILKPGGRLGLSDLTRTTAVPAQLRSLLAWIACIGDAQPLDRYTTILSHAGFTIDHIEPHDDALHDLVKTIRTRLLGAELLVKLKRLDLPSADFMEAKTLARAATAAIQQGTFGYALITATK